VLWCAGSKDASEREELKRELGLTDAEVDALTGAVPAALTSLHAVAPATTGAAAAPGARRQPPPPSSGGDVVLPPLPSRAGAARGRGRRGVGGGARGGGGGGGRRRPDETPRVLARGGQHATVGSAKTDALRAALRTSLEQVQAFTSLLKADIVAARKLCPVTSIRAQLYMRRWGMRKFEQIVNRMLYSRLLAAWQRWNDVRGQRLCACVCWGGGMRRLPQSDSVSLCVLLCMQVVSSMRLAEKRSAVSEFKKKRAIIRMLRNYEQGATAAAFDTWHRKVRAHSALLLRVRGSE
jgi:hypothetical protein